MHAPENRSTPRTSWNLAGTSLEHRWNLAGKLLEHLLELAKSCWNFSGILVKPCWKVIGTLLELCWNLELWTILLGTKAGVNLFRFFTLFLALLNVPGCDIRSLA
jgi:hypothetical protein